MKVDAGKKESELVSNHRSEIDSLRKSHETQIQEIIALKDQALTVLAKSQQDDKVKYENQI